MQKEKLTLDDVIIVMDFSNYRKAYRRRNSQSDAFATIQCLHIVVMYINPKTKGLTYEYFDYFADEDNDYHFLRRCLVRLTSLL